MVALVVVLGILVQTYIQAIGLGSLFPLVGPDMGTLVGIGIGGAPAVDITGNGEVIVAVVETVGLVRPVVDDIQSGLYPRLDPDRISHFVVERIILRQVRKVSEFVFGESEFIEYQRIEIIYEVGGEGAADTSDAVGSRRNVDLYERLIFVQSQLVSVPRGYEDEVASFEESRPLFRLIRAYSFGKKQKLIIVMIMIESLHIRPPMKIHRGVGVGEVIFPREIFGFFNLLVSPFLSFSGINFSIKNKLCQPFYAVLGLKVKK